jgi:hypothetical protein
LAWNPWIRTAVADLTGRLWTRVKSFHGSLGRELQYVLDESASPSCCTQDTVEGVKSLVSEPLRPLPPHAERLLERDPRTSDRPLVEEPSDQRHAVRDAPFR